MTSSILLYIYAYTTIELLLDIGSVYFAYRLTRITGAFRGWVLMIAAVALITLQGTNSALNLILFYPADKLQALIDSIGYGTVIEGSFFGLGVSITLFLAMLELYRTFKRLGAKQSIGG